MIALNVNKMRKSLETLKATRKKVADTADGVFRQKVYRVAELAARVSPQFSGDFVSNWHIVVDGNMPSYREGGTGAHVTSFTSLTGQEKYSVTPNQAGDLENIRPVLSRFAAQLRGVTVKSKIHLVNAAPLEVGNKGDTMIGPDGVEKLRAVNIIPGSVRIEQYLRAMMK